VFRSVVACEAWTLHRAVLTLSIRLPPSQGERGEARVGHEGALQASWARRDVSRVLDLTSLPSSLSVPALAPHAHFLSAVWTAFPPPPRARFCDARCATLARHCRRLRSCRRADCEERRAERRRGVGCATTLCEVRNDHAMITTRLAGQEQCAQAMSRYERREWERHWSATRACLPLTSRWRGLPPIIRSCGDAAELRRGRAGGCLWSDVHASLRRCCRHARNE
jgi:hypothetical protein